MDPTEAKEYIENYYSDLYSIRDENPGYTQWTQIIKDYNDRQRNENQHYQTNPFTIEELEIAIASLKNRKAPGPDKIPNEFLINANNEIKSTILKMFNKILDKENIPSSWKRGNLIRIYKGKGTKGKCSSERGITLTSNMGKTFERMINNRIMKTIQISDAQAGGRKGKSTIDHVLAVKELVKQMIKRHKTVYSGFLDVKNAFDKASKENAVYVLHNRGVTGKIWSIIDKLCDNPKITIITVHGDTNEVSINGILQQGKILSGTLFGTKMDEINRLALEKDLGIKIDDLGPVSIFIWMDDVIILSTDPEELQKLLDIANEVAKRYRLEYGKDKTKVMMIGKQIPQPEFHLGEMTLDYCEKYKYLGETLNQKWNMDDSKKELRGKIEAAYQTMLNLASDRNFAGMQMETMWKLYDTTITPLITYAAATWDPRKSDLKDIDQMQESIIKRILMTPVTTPREALYAETGLLDAEHIERKERLKMYFRINDTYNDDSLLHRILNYENAPWKTKVQKDLTDLHINDNQPNKKKVKREIDSKIDKCMQAKTNQQGESKSKYQHLTRRNTNYKCQRKNYLTKLNRIDASTIFKARSRMLDIKENFKGKPGDNLCRACKNEIETIKHVFQECEDIHEDQSLVTEINEVFEDDIPNLKSTARKIREIMDKLTDNDEGSDEEEED